jgi:hypothetical protein
MRINFFRPNPLEGLVVAGSDGSGGEAETSVSNANKIVWVDLKDRQLLGDTGLLGGAGSAVGGALGGVTSDLGNAGGGVTSDLGVSTTLGLGLDLATTAPSAAASTSQPPMSADPVTTSVPATTEVSTPPATTTSTVCERFGSWGRFTDQENSHQSLFPHRSRFQLLPQQHQLHKQIQHG